MDDIGEHFSALRKHSQAKRKNNLDYAITKLQKLNIVFKILNPNGHLLIDEYDFWPTTGLFINRNTKQKGRGINNLIRNLNND